jgi:hypothetical protein
MPRKYKHTKRGKTLNYDQAALEQAVQEVRAGRMSVRLAAESFSVPKSTIGDRLSGKYSMNVNHGRPPALPRNVEEVIVKSLKMAAKQGMGLSRKQIMRRTNVLCQRMNVRHSYKNFKAGKDWFNGLMHRFPDIVLRKPEKLSSIRASMMNPEIVSNYFRALQNIITKNELELHPERVWNCDETGFNFEHSPVNVVAEKGDRCVLSRTSAKSNNVTVMACVNAMGQSMPPMIITKGKTTRSLQGYNVREAPPNCLWSFQKNGWIDDQIGEKWFDEVFLKNCGPARPQLLILDGHGSHETLGIIERAIAENIIMLSLPPHCTHVLQPLDRTVFGPLKSAYNELCSDFLVEHPLHVINKWSFPTLFRQSWEKALSVENITNGFRACGIHPFNENAVPLTAYGPSKPTDVQLTQNGQNSISCTTTDDAMSTGTPVTTDTLLTASPYTAETISTPFTADAMLTSTLVSADVMPVATHISTDVMTVATPISVDVMPVATPVRADAADALLTSTSLPDDLQSVIDISDPTQLLQLITEGEFLVEDLSSSLCQNVQDEVDVGSLNNNMVIPSFTTLPISVPDESVKLEKCANTLFLPPVLTSRATPKRKVSTSHKILTSNEILGEKREKEKAKLEKEAKKIKNVKKIKTEK